MNSNVRGSLAKLTPAALAAVCLVSSAVLASSPALAAGCEALLEEFNRAVDAGQERQAQELVDKIATDAECGRFQVQARSYVLAMGGIETVRALKLSGGEDNISVAAT